MKRVIEILVEKEGGKLPFFNDDIIIEALQEDGISLEDARNLCDCRLCGAHALRKYHGTDQCMLF